MATALPSTLSYGRVVELVDTQHSKCCAFGRDGSTPSSATKPPRKSGSINNKNYGGSI